MKVPSPILCVVMLCIIFITTSATAAIYKWNPASGTSAKNKANWRTSCGTAGTVFPTASDTIQFDGTCSSSNCVFDTTFNVAKINVKSNYSGSISTSGSISLSFGIGVFDGGTFNGGSVTLTFNVSVKIDGCSFTSTSGTLNSYGDFTFKSGSFSHNNGTVVFHRYTETTTTIGGTSNGSSTLTLYKAEFAASSQNSIFRIRNITVEVVNEMKLSGDYHLLLNTNSSSVIEVQGNVVSSNTATVGGGDCLIIINGTGSQSLSDTHGTTATGKLCNIKIEKSSGTLSLSGNICIGGSTTWDFTDGTVNEGTARLICDYNNTLSNNSGGEMKFAKLDMVGDGGTHSIDGKILITDTFSTSNTGDCDINGDTLELQGNVVWDNTSSGSNGNVFFKFSGGEEQIVTGESTIQFNKIKLIKTGGNITLETPVSVSSDLEFVTGNMISDTVNLVTIKHGATVTGASENSFIAGAVKKIGNNSFIFPVGKDTIYNPIAITAPSSSTDAFRAEYFNYTQPHGFDMDSLTYLSGCEYWNIKRTNGSSNVKITLYWNETSCHIYVLSTLRIARWDGTNWNNTGPVTTTGNTTAGTVQTNVDQTAFGDFLIAKRSPEVIANAGSNVTINLGSSTTIGGSPTASGGVSPYSYVWIPDYALTAFDVSNPTAMPFSTQKYYLKVTDTDLSTAWDSVLVTVNGFDLKTAKRFPLLTDDTLVVDIPLNVVGAVGAKRHITGSISATDSVLINTNSTNLAIRHLDTTIQKIDALSASSLSTTLDGITITEGVYRISGNASLDGTLTLEGSAVSYIVIDINGDFYIADNSEIILDGIQWHQVYFRVDDVIISGEAILNGIFILSGQFLGDVIDGNFWILAKGKIRGELKQMQTMLFPELLTPSREIANYFGYNVANVVDEYGLNDDEFKTNVNNDKMLLLKPDLLRYPAGSDANWWRWESGWFRGYNNPAYNEDLSTPQVKFEDNLPFPTYCLDGIPWDLNIKDPQYDHFLDLKNSVNAVAAHTIYNLNLLSSDLGTQIGGLFEAACQGIPIKYIELGNEFYFNGEEPIALYPTGTDYVELANEVSRQIKEYFPDVHISIVASDNKDVEGTGGVRLSEWNNQIEAFITDPGNDIYFDALSFHVYTVPETDAECNLDEYDDGEPNALSRPLFMGQILSTPFTIFESMETATDPQKEFLLLDENLEGWITEFNMNDNFHNMNGRWVHGLFTALSALVPLQNEYITKSTCYDLFDAARRSVIFDYTGPFNQPCTSINNGNATLWEMGAVGRTLRYVGRATKNARSGFELYFGQNGPKIFDKLNHPHPGLYGWFFSSSLATSGFSAKDSNWAVILNLTNSETNVNVHDYFLLGGSYYILKQNSTNSLATPLGFIEDAADIDETQLTLTTGEITLPPYSIVLVVGKVKFVGTPIVEVASSSFCVNNVADLYISCPGGLSYDISPGYLFKDESLPTVLATVKLPLTSNTFTIKSQTGTQTTITIPAYNKGVIAPTVSGTPACTGAAVDVDANGTGTLNYNWFPSPDYETIYNEESFEVSPSSDITYTVNAQNGTCYCGKAQLFIDKYERADAGQDIYICTDPENNVVMGNLASYPGATLVQWINTDDVGENSPNLSGYYSAQTTLDVSDLEPGDYNYTITVYYPGFCQYSDEIVVHVLECCTSVDANAKIFNPYDDYSTDKKYLTASFLLGQFSSSTYDNICGAPVDNIPAINGFTYPLIINGLFYIDQPIAFVDCSNILFGPHAKIIVEPNGRLLIKSSNLSACGEEMWQGIEVIGNLNQKSGLEVTERCSSGASRPSIEDAERAVYLAKDSRFIISDCDFTNNFDNITLEDFRFSANATITNNTMTRNSSILAPHSGEYSRIGISLTDVPGVDFAITGNEISFTDTAVYSDDAGFSLLPIDNVSPIPDVFNTFSNVGKGVLVMNGQTNTVVSGNIISDCNTGIASYYNTDISILMEKNTITTKEIDVSNSKYPIGIDVIDIDCTDPLECSGSVTIGGINSDDGNLISSEGLIGISIVGTLNALVAKNKVLMNTDATSIEMWGIKVNGALNANIQANKINDPDAGYGDYPFDCIPASECSTANKRAITILDAIGCSIICNRTNATETGIQFLATGDNVDLQSIVRGNTFQWHNDGLAIGALSGYGSNTTIGPQVEVIINSTTYLPGNYWKGDGTGAFGTGGATHTFNTDNDLATFKINLSTYTHPLYYTNLNAQTFGTIISMDDIDGIAPFNCYGEAQHAKLDNSLTDFKNQKCCFLYPNPTADFTILNYDMNVNELYDVYIQDLYGRKVFNKIIEGKGELLLPSNLLTSGVFILSIFYKKENIFHEKIFVIK